MKTIRVLEIQVDFMKFNISPFLGQELVCLDLEQNLMPYKSKNISTFIKTWCFPSGFDVLMHNIWLL